MIGAWVHDEFEVKCRENEGDGGPDARLEGGGTGPAGEFPERKVRAKT